MDDHEFSTGKAISFGWHVVASNFGPLISVFISYFGLVAMPLLCGLATVQNKFISILFFVLSFFLAVSATAGFIVVGLKSYNGGDININTFFYGFFRYFFRYVPVAFYYLFLILAGLVMLVVPGFIFAVRYSFCGCLTIDKNMSIKESIQASKEIVKGSEGRLLGFYLLLLLINVLGICCLLVGFCITLPLSFFALVYVYKQLTNENVEILDN